MEEQSKELAGLDEGVGATVPVAEVDATEAPAGPPPGYEGVPQELWPGPDGKPPELTPALMKKMRGKYFTVRHPKLACSHRLDMINQPKNNCHECWAAFFSTHPQLVEVAHQFYQTQGRGPMVGMRGSKFVKFFEKFMALMYAEMQRREKEKASGTENQEPGSGTTVGSVSADNPDGVRVDGETSRTTEGESNRGNQSSDFPAGEELVG
jgi:hypothetical protein